MPNKRCHPIPDVMTDALITQRLSTSALSQKILEMATTGVYRESVFEAFQPIATKKQIREAIAHAKRFGLYSIADLRDSDLGTYYQLDAAKYQALQHALHSPIHLGKDAELVQRLTQANQTLSRLVSLTRSFALLLIGSGLAAWYTGWHSIGFGLLSAALATIVLWQVQRQFTKSLD